MLWCKLLTAENEKEECLKCCQNRLRRMMHADAGG